MEKMAKVEKIVIKEMEVKTSLLEVDFNTRYRNLIFWIISAFWSISDF